ncbi:MAG: hypothetical protein IJ038_02870 [Clostridia bacterium]|nr:hypothetical protein [Clostridia bacterium]
MSIPFTAEINPKGNTAEQKQEDLIRQLRRQNEQLKVIIADLYKKAES